MTESLKNYIDGIFVPEIKQVDGRDLSIINKEYTVTDKHICIIGTAHDAFCSITYTLLYHRALRETTITSYGGPKGPQVYPLTALLIETGEKIEERIKQECRNNMWNRIITRLIDNVMLEKDDITHGTCHKMLWFRNEVSGILVTVDTQGNAHQFVLNEPKSYLCLSDLDDIQELLKD